MDSHGPQQPRFDIFELTQALWRTHFKFGGKFKFFQILHKSLQYGCLWTPMGLSNQDLTFLSWLKPSRGSRVLISNLAGNSNFLNFFTKPNNESVYGLPWASATKTWHFWADSGPLKGPGVPFKYCGKFNLFHFFTKPNKMGVYRFP